MLGKAAGNEGNTNTDAPGPSNLQYSAKLEAFRARQAVRGLPPTGLLTTRTAFVVLGGACACASC